MNSIVRRFCFICTCLASSVGLKSQSLETELLSIRDVYITTNQYSFDVEVLSYASEFNNQSELLSTGFVMKNGNSFFSAVNDHEMLILEDDALVIDKKNKIINYYKLTGQQTAALVNKNNFDIEAVMNASDSIVFHPAYRGTKHFTIYSESGYIRQTEMYVDESSNFISRILYYYAETTDEFEVEADRVEILYKNIQTDLIDQKELSVEKYLYKQGTKYYPTAEYRGFEISFHSS